MWCMATEAANTNSGCARTVTPPFRFLNVAHHVCVEATFLTHAGMILAKTCRHTMVHTTAWASRRSVVDMYDDCVDTYIYMHQYQGVVGPCDVAAELSSGELDPAKQISSYLVVPRYDVA